MKLSNNWNKMWYTMLLIVMMLISGNGQVGYKIMYSTDRDGNRIEGSLSELITHVNNGLPLRVGWKLPIIDPQSKDRIDLIHWADAGFITIWNGHLFAQIRPIFQQGPSMEGPSIFLPNDMPNGWVAIISTTGIMRQKFKEDPSMTAELLNFMTKEEIEKQWKDSEKVKVNTMWAVPVKE